MKPAPSSLARTGYCADCLLSHPNNWHPCGAFLCRCGGYHTGPPHNRTPEEDAALEARAAELGEEK